MTSDDFARAITAMVPTLHRVACSYLRQGCDREDAVQEALRKAWEKRAALRDERYLQTWVIRILINECRTLCRRASRVTPAEEIRAGRTDARPLQEALLSLEEKFRLPILLHYVEGREVAEVAQLLRIPQGTVKSRLSRGRAKLRALLEEEVFGE